MLNKEAHVSLFCLNLLYLFKGKHVCHFRRLHTLASDIMPAIFSAE